MSSVLPSVGSELSTLDELRAVMRSHRLSVKPALRLRWAVADESEHPVRFAVWELHFDEGGVYGDGLEIDLDDPLREPEWQAMRAALCALDLWEYPDPRPFLGHP